MGLLRRQDGTGGETISGVRGYVDVRVQGYWRGNLTIVWDHN